MAQEECQVPLNQCHQPPNKSPATSLSLFLLLVTTGTVLKIFLCKIFPQLLALFSLMSDIHSLGVSQAGAQSEFLF